MMEIATRYEQCIKIVKNAAQINKEDRIAVLYKNDKELYKQLKRKLHIKKKKGINLHRRNRPKKVTLDTILILSILEKRRLCPLTTNTLC